MQPWQNDNQFTPIVICTLRPKSATSPNLQLGGVNQNLHLKLGQQTPSVGTLLVFLETTKVSPFNLEKQKKFCSKKKYDLGLSL